MATYTAVQAGDWWSATTWQGGNPPVNAQHAHMVGRDLNEQNAVQSCYRTAFRGGRVDLGSQRAGQFSARCEVETFQPVSFHPFPDETPGTGRQHLDRHLIFKTQGSLVAFERHGDEVLFRLRRVILQQVVDNRFGNHHQIQRASADRSLAAKGQKAVAPRFQNGAEIAVPRQDAFFVYTNNKFLQHFLLL